MKKFVLHFFLYFFTSLSAYSQAVCPQAAVSNYWKEVAANDLNSAAIKTDGTLWVWGSNGSGQVSSSRPSHIPVTTPFQIGTGNNWAQVSLGLNSVFALKTDGSLWAWGDNGFGQLGTGNTTAVSTPTQVQPGTVWKSISTSLWSILAIKSDGSLWAWGNNQRGQLGTGNTTNYSTPVRIGTGTSWSSVSTGFEQTLAIQTNGTLWGWGTNNLFQVGDGTGNNRFTPVQIGTATNWKKAVAGTMLSVAVRTDGTLWGWGAIGTRYGAGNTSNSAPVRISPSRTFNDVYHGNGYIMAIDQNGNSHLAGGGYYFQNLKTDVFQYDTLVPLNQRYLKYGMSSYSVFGIDSTGSIWAWGRTAFDTVVTRSVISISTTNRELSVCKGSALTVGTVPSGYTGVTYAWVSYPAGTTSALAQPSFTFNRPGMVVVSAAKTGCSTTYDTAYVHLRAAPETVVLPKWKEVHYGNGFYMAITNTGELWGWGDNTYREGIGYQLSGVMGHMNYNNDPLPIRIHSNKIWKTLALNSFNNHVIALDENGFAFIWGKYVGPNPIMISNIKFMDIVQERDLSVLLDENGAVWSGYQSFNLVKFPNKKVIAIAAGNYSVCVVAQDGTLWSWGQNTSGELGIGNTIAQSFPVRVGTATDWVDVAFQPVNFAANNSFIGLKANGSVFQWGKKYNSTTYTFQNVLSPTLISTSNIFVDLLPDATVLSNTKQVYRWNETALNPYGIYANYYTTEDVNLRSMASIDTFGRLYVEGVQVKAFGSNKQVCSGNTIQLGLGTSNSNFTYSWSSSAGNISGSLYPNSVQVNANQVITLNTTNVNTGCTFLEKTYLNIFSSSSHAGVDANLCESKNYSVTLGSNALPNHSYSWTSLPVGFLSNQPKIQVEVLDEGPKFYIVKDSLEGGCSIYDTVKITPIQAPYSAIYPFWRTVSTGPNFSHGIRSDGTLWTWGGNNPPLGDGTTIQRNSPVQIGISRNWKNIKAGMLYTIGLQLDGSLWSWGNGNNGVLGRGTVTSSTSPVQIGTATWRKFSCGPQHVLAIGTDGSLWAWGYNANGQLGIGNTTTQTTPIRIGTATDWREVAAGENFSIAVKNDGTLWTWGSNANKQLGNNSTISSLVPIQVGSAKDWVKVSAGSETGFAIKMDSTLWAWGLDGSEGMTGTGSTHTFPYQVGVPTQVAGKWLSVSCSGFSRVSNGIKVDSTLWSWGSNQNYGYGDPTMTSSKVPVLVSSKRYLMISNQYSHGILLDQNNAILTWGQNGWGQLGVGNTIDHYTPKQMNAWSRELEVCVGTSINLGSATISGLSYNWEVPNTNVPNVSSTSYTFTTQAFNNVYYFGLTTGSNVFPNCYSKEIISVMSKSRPDFGTTSTICQGSSFPLKFSTWNYGLYSIMKWNSNPIDTFYSTYYANEKTIRPNGSTIAYLTDSTSYPFGCVLRDSVLITVNPKPEAVAATYWKKVVSGNGFSIGIKTDGTLWSWGANTVGQLGLGNTTPTNTPTKVGTSSIWSDVSAGDNHVLAVQKDGTLWAWGSNTAGKLGDGTTVNKLSPVRIGTAVNWRSVSAGLTHSAGIQTNGFLFAWGDNSLGQLGTGNTISVSNPTRVGTATNWLSVEAGEKTTVGIRTAMLNWCGSLWVWGEQKINLAGSPTYNVPTQIGMETNWWKISCRGTGKAALQTNGYLYTWGFSLTNAFYNQNTPVLRSSDRWINVAAGQMNLHAQKENGTIWAMGANAGTLGDGTTNFSNSLIQIPFTGENVVQMDHNYHFTGVDRKGAFWTISTNTNGESGIATFVPFVPNRSVADKDIKTCNSTVLLGQTAVVGNTYQWNANYNLISTSAVFSATPINYLTSYQLQVANATGCTQRDTITLEGGKTRINKPSGLVKACYGQNMVITPEVTSGSHRYSWSTNRSAADTATNTSSFNLAKVNSVFSVYLTDSFLTGKCSTQDTATLSIFKPTVAAKNNYIQVSSINTHGLAIRNDGTLWAWGTNANGQLGDGTTTTRTTPIQIGTERNWVYVSAGATTSFAIKADGSLWSWGENVSGSLGRTGTANVPGQVGTEKNWSYVSAGSLYAFGIKFDGTLWTWGLNTNGRMGIGATTSASVPTQVGVQSDWLKISAVANHALAIKKDNSLWVWGEGANGKLGLGSTTTYTTPVRLGTANDWLDIASGAQNSFAIKSNGTLWGWGLDGGKLGNGGIAVNQSIPVQIGSQSNWKTISTSLTSQSFIGTQADLSLWIWGSNNVFQLGNGTAIDVVLPTRIREGENWIHAMMAVGNSYLVSNKRSLSIAGSGFQNSTTHIALDANSNEFSYCSPTSTTLGATALPNVTYSWQSSPNIGMYSTSSFTYTASANVTWTVTAIDTNGCTAKDTAFVASKGIPSNNLGADRSNCKGNTITIGNWASTGETFSWASIPVGYSSSNALANVAPTINTQYIRTVTNNCGTKLDTLAVVINVPNAGADQNVCLGSDAKVKFTKIAQHSYSWSSPAGFERTMNQDTLTVKKVEKTAQMFLDDWDSTASCFSKDTVTLTVLPSPLAVPALYWTDVATGMAHTLAVRSDGTLWAWGSGGQGQLGDGTSTNRAMPVQVGTASDWEKVFAYNNSSFATKTNGDLYAWGNNNQYILGTGDLLTKTTPVLINTTGGWKNISCNTHCMAVKRDGTLWGWGQNSAGEIMNGTTTVATTPRQIGSVSDYVDVVAGTNFSMALRSVGSLYGAGFNVNKVLSSAANTSFVTPIQVAPQKTWKAIASGKESVTALATDGTLWSWGRNDYGQLGLANNVQTNTPQQIGSSNQWSEVVGDGFSLWGKQSNQSVWAWGFNLQGQLGIGNKINQNAPVLMDSSYAKYKISAGGDHVLALSPNGQLFVTGANSSNVFTSTMGAVSFERPAIIPSNGKEIFPCMGTAWTLGRASKAGESYQWFIDSTGCTNCNFSTASSPTVGVSEYKTYGLRVSLSNGCTDTKKVTITPKTAPVFSLGANRDFCQGDVTNLGTAPDTSTTFTWSSVPVGLNSNLSSISVSPNQTTQYTVNAVNRCGTTNRSVTLTYEPLKTPVVTIDPIPDTVTSDLNITFRTTAQYPGNLPVWEWYKNGQYQSGISSYWSGNQWNDYDTVQVVMLSTAKCRTKPADTATKVVRVMNIRNIPGDFQSATVCTPIQNGIENMVRDSAQNLVYSVLATPAGLNQVCWGIRQFGGASVRKSLWNGGQQLTYWLDRNFYIEPNQQPGVPVTVKFYFDSVELNEIIDSVSQQTAQVFHRDSIRLFKFSTPNLDLDPLNNGNADSAFQILTPRISAWHINPKFTVLEFQINSFSEFSFGIKANNPNPLPIETLRWKVEKKGNDALVQWTQPQEESVDAYEVQFSTTGKDFQTIHSVASGQNTYHFLQSNAGDLGKTGYYRMAEINRDGTRAYSQVQKLMWNSSLQFGPNPVLSKGNVSSSKTMNSNWELTDAQGRVLRKGLWMGKELEMDFQGLAPGTYFVRTAGEVLKWVKE